jgi:hypothetical protein
MWYNGFGESAEFAAFAIVDEEEDGRSTNLTASPDFLRTSFACDMMMRTNLKAL